MTPIMRTKATLLLKPSLKFSIINITVAVIKPLHLSIGTNSANDSFGALNFDEKDKQRERRRATL